MIFPYVNWEMVWGGLPVSYSSPLETMAPLAMIIFISFMIWDVIWKGISLWKAGRNNQLGWFIALLVVNSLGILPIIYILFFQKKKVVIIPKGDYPDLIPKSEPTMGLSKTKNFKPRIKK